MIRVDRAECRAYREYAWYVLDSKGSTLQHSAATSQSSFEMRLSFLPAVDSNGLSR